MYAYISLTNFVLTLQLGCFYSGIGSNKIVSIRWVSKAKIKNDQKTGKIKIKKKWEKRTKT